MQAVFGCNMDIEKIREFFKDDTYATFLGITIDEVEQDKTVCSMTLTENHHNVKNGAHGGVIYSLADFTFAVASNSRGKLTVTLDSHINYLTVAKGKKLIATAKMVNQTRHTSHFAVEVKDELGNLVAVADFNGYVRDIDVIFN